MSAKESSEQQLQAEYERAYHRLHHLSMRYVGAMLEAATGQPVGLLPANHPGLSQMRDLIDLILICRAEINALTQLCYEKGVFTQAEHTRQLIDDIRWLEKQKARFLNVTVTDTGLTFHNPFTQQ